LGINSEAEMNRKIIEFFKLLNVYLNHFPKYEKYALSNQIRNTAYEMYGYISECRKRYYKKTALTSLDITHERLRMQLYLAKELGYFNFNDGKKYFGIYDNPDVHRFSVISNLNDELGRMIGGWIKKFNTEGQQR
jgi:hypothetical protein